MRQGDAARVNLDLDDLERQLSAASGPRRSGSDDPLAELARIVGHADGGSRASGKAAGSFDDFLVNPPRSVTEMMGAPPSRAPSLPPQPATPAPMALSAKVEPLFPQNAPPTAAPPHSLEQQLAEALGEMPLRPALPVEEPAVPQPVAPPPVAAQPPFAAMPPAEPPALTEPPSLQTSDPRFEEMLKEFDAAMRDVGAQPIQAAPPIEPAPETRTAPALSPALAYDPEAEDHAPSASPQQGRSRLGMALAGGVIGVALIGAAGLLAFGGGSKTAVNGAAPVIAAKPGVIKERPANPGGVEVPNQDKEILARAPTTPQAERVVPREEQPVDLTQAQRSADAQANPGGVRQIPGVIVLGPSSSQPPAAGSSTPPVAPPAQPRPVASVPITIAGQPTVEAPAIVAPTPPAITAPAAPRPIAAAPTTTAGPAAPTAPAAPLATTAQPGQNAANQTSATEPRRVRAVPIRPEESAPNRAQAQPRVVPNPPLRPAAPIQAEADDANGPLRITPQGVRSQPAPSRAAAVAPGTVPSSTSAPVTTQSTTPDPAPSGGGSFAVQIAAEGSQDAAQAKFNRMRAQHSGVLGGVSPTIRSAEVNGRSVYRVRVGQMSREEAVSLCERLKADGGSCFVARN